MIRDRIVIGLEDKSLSEKLQLEAELALENAINQARQRELVRQQGIIRQEGLIASNVDNMKSFQPNSQNKHTKLTLNSNVKSQGQNCGRCGVSQHKRNEYPAIQSICNRYKEKDSGKVLQNKICG